MHHLVKHPFHLVNESPWPIWAALSLFLLMSSSIELLHLKNPTNLFPSLIILLWVSYKWWMDVSSEGTLLGQHSLMVQTGLRWGMVLFIVSEVLFFASFFWEFFHNSLSPSYFIGSTWPPLSIKVLNPFQVPLLNTIILLSSGASVTWAHHSLMSANHPQTKASLALTIILGIYFTFLQKIEYDEASFTIADSVYGASFFLTTGFHGLHVIIGTIFLTVCLIRLSMCNFSKNHHFGFEAAAWYWHFVDVVWLFLFISIYWWGSPIMA